METNIFPKNLIFEVTQRCNSNCMYCYNVWKNDTSYPRGELSTGATKKLLEKALRESKANLITLTGGEPLLRKDLEEVVRFLKNLHTEVNIITNATLLNDKKIRRLIELGVSMFEVPLLSGRREVHNKLMGLEAFDLITEAIVKVKKYNGKVVTVFVATKENINDFKEMAKLSFALGADGIMFNRFNPGGQGAKYINELLPTPQQIDEALTIAESFSEKYNIGISCSIPIHPCIIDTAKFKKIGFGFCSAGTEKSYYTIDPLGNLRMCNHSKLILGNLFRESFDDLISKDIAHNFISIIPDLCLHCEMKDTCMGGCKAAAEVCFGSLNDEEPFLKTNKSKCLAYDVGGVTMNGFKKGFGSL